ncbi:MAG: AsmA-like C-terminal region-containing protein [Pseudomonadales bacterium]
MSQVAKNIVRVLVGLILLLALAFAVGISLTLNGLAAPATFFIKQLTGLDSRIEGDIEVTLGFTSSLKINGLVISDQIDGREVLRAELLTAEFGPLLLFQQHLQLDEVTADGVTLNIDTATLTNNDKDWKQQLRQKKPLFLDPESVWQLSVNLDQLNLSDIHVLLMDRKRNLQSQLQLDSGAGNIPWFGQGQLEFIGNFHDNHYVLTLSFPGLELLLDPSSIWKADANLQLHDLVAKLQLNHNKNATAMLNISGDSFDKLASILQTELPPLKNYELSATLAETPTGYHLNESRLRIGNSELSGNVTLELTNKPQLNVTLRSSQIFLDDFPSGGWEFLDNNDDRSNPTSNRHIVDLFNANFDIAFDDVRSGDESLGSGSAMAQIIDGTAILAPLHLSLPGGDLLLEAELKEGQRGTDIYLSAKVEDFDYGILARRRKPDSDVRGKLDLDISLRSDTVDIVDLLRNADGHFNFALWPENFESDVFDLWAVDLVTAGAGRHDDISELNCVVARFTMEQGQMDAQSLFVDTSGMQVLGRGKVDFHQQQIDLVLAPQPKGRHFISAATPVGIKGSFEDFDMDLKNADIAETVIRNLANIGLYWIPQLLKIPGKPQDFVRCEKAFKEDVRLYLKDERPAD